jgi:aldehyde dehydrogenase (NAD+)
LLIGNHIFYTGNARIARIISLAAAKHLTPLTLELGGKSPVLLCPSLSTSSRDPTSPLSIAAKRILWGKINNSGQICVAPDYILVPRSIIPDFIVALKHWCAEFFPDAGGPLESASYGGIVSQAHYDRLKAVLGRTMGKVEFGGKYEEGGLKRKWGMEPTVVVDVKENDALLEEYEFLPILRRLEFDISFVFREIFGPILPIVAVEDVDEAIEFLNERYDQSLHFYSIGSEPHLKTRPTRPICLLHRR